MFGRRATATHLQSAPPAPSPAKASGKAAPSRAADATPPAPGPSEGPPTTAPEPPVRAGRNRMETAGLASEREEKTRAFYETKDSVYAALIEMIDITQLSKMSRDKARQEVTDIVREIMALRRMSLPVVEQDILQRQICDDLLGYGPLEPLLARDDIADIMVNGTDPIFIEVGGRIEETPIRFRDNAQLLTVCQKIVSQVGRRVDEVQPDLRRAPARRQPRQRDRPAAGDRRHDPDDPQVQARQADARQAGRVRVDHARGRRDPADHRSGPLQRTGLGRHRLGQDDAAELPVRTTSTTRSGSSPARIRPSCSCSSRMSSGWRPGRRTSRGMARSPCASWSRTACACGPSGSSSARCAGPRRSTCCRR